jgi:hypothetical protein
MMPTYAPVIVDLIAHRNRVLGLQRWLQGADFATERGWLEPEETERFEREDAAWGETLQTLAENFRLVRRDHEAEFLVWIDYEITTLKLQVKHTPDATDKKRARQALRRWHAVRGGRRADYFFERFP